MSSPFKFNPFTGNLDRTATKQTVVETAEKIAETFDCLAGAAVGDVVVPSRTTQNLVLTLSSNVYDDAAFGIIIEKITLTTCKVLISGKLAGAAFGLGGLTFGKPLFISTSGTIPTTPPTTGHLQKMGIAIKTDTIFLLPSLEKVIQT